MSYLIKAKAHKTQSGKLGVVLKAFNNGIEAANIWISEGGRFFPSGQYSTKGSLIFGIDFVVIILKILYPKKNVL